MRKKKVATEEVQEGATMSLTELKNMSMSVLMELAEKYEIENASSMRKQELSLRCCRLVRPGSGAILRRRGLEILPDRLRFLRSPLSSYMPGPGRYLCFPLSDSALLSAQGLMWFPGRYGLPRKGSVISPCSR